MTTLNKSMDETISASQEALLHALRALQNGWITVVTGAGISLASGIATFRGTDVDAVWKKDVTELGTYQYFRDDPVGSWLWYTSRFDSVLDKLPNAAHVALAHLERWQESRGGRYLLVTQNVDTLHEDAGSHAMVKVHGSANRVRCSRAGCEHGAPAGSLTRDAVDIAAFKQNPSTGTLPRCPSCGSFIRQHVLWFDEFYDGHEDYEWPRVLDAASQCDLLLFVGTSFAVGVTDLYLRQAIDRDIPVFAIDPGARKPPHPSVIMVSEKAEITLPALIKDLAE